MQLSLQVLAEASSCHVAKEMNYNSDEPSLYEPKESLFFSSRTILN